jgi:hypothetical protein
MKKDAVSSLTHTNNDTNTFYGTAILLRNIAVKRNSDVFNKLLSGTEDQLAGYKLKRFTKRRIWNGRLFCSHAQ